MMITEVTEKLKEYGTPTQNKYIDAVIKYGSAIKAAKELGIQRSGLSRAIRRAKANAAKCGYSVEEGQVHVDEGYHIKGKSTLRNGVGETIMEWTKTDLDKEKVYQALVDAFSMLSEDYIEKSLKILPPSYVQSKCLTVYPVADPHIGMYAWIEEAGDDFDVEIAEELLVGAVHRLVDCAPPTEHALIANLGDFFHADTVENKTLRGGNVLDVDTRWAKVLRVGVRIIVEIVHAALRKHKHVKVINDIGNHDDHTAVMLSIVLEAYFKNNTRVEIDMSPAKMHYHTFGKNLIGTTHGDTVKIDMLGQIMATDMPKEWGNTEHRMWLTGHIHQRRVIEMPGCVVETFNTLAAKDMWTYSKGYRSGRNMNCIVFHKDFGEIERHKIDVCQVQQMIGDDGAE